MFRRLTAPSRLGAALAAALLSACAASSGSPPAGSDPAGGSSPLVNTEWTLTSFENAGELLPFESYVRFTNGWRLTASSGCNMYSGSYSIAGQSLSVDPHLAGTLMACEAHVADPEQRYIEALQLATRYEVAGDGLVIHLANGGRLIFDRR